MFWLFTRAIFVDVTVALQNCHRTRSSYLSQ